MWSYLYQAHCVYLYLWMVCMKIIPYVMAWEETVTNYHKKGSKEIGIINSIEAYIQANVQEYAGKHLPRAPSQRRD